jgi:hypothetical protein
MNIEDGYPKVLYTRDKKEWIQVFNSQQERDQSKLYRSFHFDWGAIDEVRKIMNDENEFTWKDLEEPPKKPSVEMIQQDLFAQAEKELLQETKKENHTSDLLEDPIDRKHKRGRKPKG